MWPRECMWADTAEVSGDGVTESSSHLGKVLSCLGWVQQWTSAVSDRCWPTPEDGHYASCCLNSLAATLLGTYICFVYLFIPKYSPISWFLLPTHLPKSQNATLHQFLSISFTPFLPSATSTLECFSCGSVLSIFWMLRWLLITVFLHHLLSVNALSSQKAGYQCAWKSKDCSGQSWTKR